MSGIDDILRENNDSHYSIKKTRRAACTIQLLNLIALISDSIALILEKVNNEERWYFAFIPIGVVLIGIIITFIQLSTLNFFKTSRFGCILITTFIMSLLQLGTHVAMALPMTSNVSQRAKYFMWGSSGVMILLVILSLWKSIYIYKYMSHKKYENDIDYSILSEQQKNYLLKKSIQPQ